MGVIVGRVFMFVRVVIVVDERTLESGYEGIFVAVPRARAALGSGSGFRHVGVSKLEGWRGWRWEVRAGLYTEI